MLIATKEKLVAVAREQALLPYHGYLDGHASNLQPIIGHFPLWNLREADGLWCAAFVYHCCIEAGFEIPYRPKECVSSNLAGCLAWEEFAFGDPRLTYYKPDALFSPMPGDLVLYDRVFCGVEHDHIGIVLEVYPGVILAAEGNVDNRSGLIRRPLDGHIRAFIRLPDGYRYE